MILQQSPGKQVVYMADIDAGHVVLGESMGLCDIHGRPALHAFIDKMKYTTNCGVSVDAWRMKGETVDVFVLPDRVKITGKDGPSLAKALNSFDSPRYDFDKYVFTGKFTSVPGRNTVDDHMGRKMTTTVEAVKDIPGIFNLMAHLGDDGGALFHPVIAMYMSHIWHIGKRPSRFQPVGYVDLHEYLQVMRDDRRNMFSRDFSGSLINVQLGRNPFVKVTGVDPKTGQALLEIGDAMVIDREKDRNFKPYVLIANRPFELRQELKFRWTKVDFKGHSVFLMPVMSLQSTFGSMLNMINLLSVNQ